MGKSTISMAIFNSKLFVYQRVCLFSPIFHPSWSQLTFWKTFFSQGLQYNHQRVVFFHRSSFIFFKWTSHRMGSSAISASTLDKLLLDFSEHLEWKTPFHPLVNHHYPYWILMIWHGNVGGISHWHPGIPWFLSDMSSHRPGWHMVGKKKTDRVCTCMVYIYI